MAVTCEMRGAAGLVQVSGTLLSGNAESFRQVFDGWLAQSGCRQVVVDLSGVEQMDSTGLGSLIGAMKKVVEQGGDLRLAALQKRVRLVFEITRTHRVFEIFDTVEEALRAAGA